MDYCIFNNQPISYDIWGMIFKCVNLLTLQPWAVPCERLESRIAKRAICPTEKWRVVAES